MVLTLMLGLAVAGQTKEAPVASAAITHMGMEIDDLDYEIRRHHSALLLAKARLTSTQRAFLRGVSSRSEVEQVTADVRSLEAREGEGVAFRALKVYERGVIDKSISPDEDK
ncbi:MAG TPA: hypothetical protein VGZ22_16765, partial [Isosphaeraceae bacterium]|nr:hypothetical protein [Isosphaeraceae bacterium]